MESEEKEYQIFLKKVSNYIYLNKNLIPLEEMGVFEPFIFKIHPYFDESCYSCGYISKFLDLLEDLSHHGITFEEFKNKITLSKCEHKFSSDLNKYFSKLSRSEDVLTLIYYFIQIWIDIPDYFKKRFENIGKRYMK